MNYALIFKLIGNILKIEAAFMLVPLIVSFIYNGEDKAAFALSVIILAVCGILLSLIKPKAKKFNIKDAFASTALSWLFLSLCGALPFYFSGCFKSFIDCVFESISGFTTTGSTILTDIESLPKGILFWRSFSHWIGGMGVLVFMLAIMPSMNASSINLLRAESTGPSPNRVVPQIKETARILYLIYLTMTAVLIILLLISGLPLYDSLIHAFSAAGTGGFSNMNASVGAYNNIAAEIILTVFVFLFGVNFSLYFYLLKRNFKQILKDEELRFYFIIVITAIAVITINITNIYGSVWEALRHSSFQVSTIITTTGFSTADFNLWHPLSQGILMLLMLTGCCAGSTGGGIKLIRIVIMFKTVKVELNKMIHPQSVKVVTVNGKKIDGDIVSKVGMFFFIYFAICVVSVMLVSIEGKDILTNVTAVISTLSNIGPGLSAVGPAENFSSFTPFSKIIFSFCMIAGRLEFFPVLILFKPSLWMKKS